MEAFRRGWGCLDTGGLVVAGVTVKARNVATGTVYTVVSDERGRYTFAALPPGTYEVTASATSLEVSGSCQAA